MDNELKKTFDDVREKVVILTVKLEEYLKEIEENKDDIKNIRNEKKEEIEKLSIICSELKQSINDLKQEDAKQVERLNFIVKAFWIGFSAITGIVVYLFKSFINK